MNWQRIGVLLKKELVWGPKNFLFIWAIVTPLVLSLLVLLLVGTIFSGRPQLGLVAEGQSQLVTQLGQLDGLDLRTYESADELLTAVRGGAVDMGLVLPVGFDQQMVDDTAVSLTVYVYGESLLRDRAFLATALVNQLRSLDGQESPITIVTETLGDGQSVPWEERLLPLVVMMAVLLGGLMVPAASLVEEKQKRTITAVTTAAVSLEEIFMAKGILGASLSLVMGILILIINQAFGTQPLLLVGLLALGAIMAAALGVLLGAFVKDINSLFATVKGLAILLYAPAFIYLFPTIPEWVGRIFPTYYMINPIVEVTQNGAVWADIWGEVLLLVLLNLALIGIIAVTCRRARTQPTMLPGVVS
jgi:ABC-2 type transport system permease protein